MNLKRRTKLEYVDRESFGTQHLILDLTTLKRGVWVNYIYFGISNDTLQVQAVIAGLTIHLLLSLDHHHSCASLFDPSLTQAANSFLLPCGVC